MKQLFPLTLLIALLVNTTFAQTPKAQEPLAPFPYKTEEVTIQNTADNITLTGTLTLPQKGSGFPVALLLSGSGAQDRDSELMGHKPFLVLADYLTKNGIAVLRLDDRGVGGSTGVYDKTGINDLKRDAEYALQYLKTRKEINPKKMGLIGHSLGGAVAQVAAVNNKDISYIVIMAGPGLRGDKLMLLQKEKIERGIGIPERAITAGQKQIGGAYAIIMASENGGDALKKELVTYFSEAFGPSVPESQLDAMATQLTFSWFSDLVRYDPEKVLKNIKCPVLALNGSNDMQVTPENLAAIETGIKAGGNKKVTVKELPTLNHLFQESDTGMPFEYGEIEQTIAPVVLSEIGTWIKENTK